MALRLLLDRALGLGLRGATDEAAFLDFEPARLEDRLPEVEGDLGEALDRRDLFFVAVVRPCAAGGGRLCVLDLGGDPGWVASGSGGRWQRCCIYR